MGLLYPSETDRSVKPQKMFWFQQGLCFLPAFLVIWSSSTFIISYIVAFVRRDVPIIFPYISDTGAIPPESCIFGLMTFISACAGIANIYARYKYVEKRSETIVVKPCLNKAALYIGLLSCLGMCIVATFQSSTELTEVTVAHYIGALLFFLSGIIYLILQTIVSKAFPPPPHTSSRCVLGVRLCLIILATLMFLGTVVCTLIVRVAVWRGTPYIKVNHYEIPGAVCEWFAAFSFIFFFYTFIDDFKHFTLKVITEYEGFS